MVGDRLHFTTFDNARCWYNFIDIGVRLHFVLAVVGGGGDGGGVGAGEGGKETVVWSHFSSSLRNNSGRGEG